MNILLATILRAWSSSTGSSFAKGTCWTAVVLWYITASLESTGLLLRIVSQMCLLGRPLYECIDELMNKRYIEVYQSINEGIAFDLYRDDHTLYLVDWKRDAFEKDFEVEVYLSI